MALLTELHKPCYPGMMILTSAQSVNKVFQSQVGKEEAALRLHIAGSRNERKSQNLKSCGITKEHIFSDIFGEMRRLFWGAVSLHCLHLKK